MQLIIINRDDDVAALRRANFRSVRVVTSTETLYVATASSYELDPTLSVFDRIVLALPIDCHELRDDIAIRLGDTRCTWVDFTDDLPGCAEYIQEAGPEALKNAIAAAKPMWTDEVCRFRMFPMAVMRWPMKPAPSLDMHGVRLGRPAFMPIIGPYGSGKSVILRQLATSLWKKHGWKTLLTSFEEKIKPRFEQDLRKHMIGKAPQYWTEELIARADTEIDQAFRFLRRKRNASLDLERLLDRIEFAVKVHGIDVVMIDPVNEIDHAVPRGQSKTDYMGDFIKALKVLADDYDLLMIVAAHPPKDGVERRLAKGRLLTLNDGADTSHYGNKADFGWCAWRPTFDGPTFLHVDKVKSHEIFGKPTLFELRMDAMTGGFVCVREGYDIAIEGAV